MVNCVDNCKGYSIIEEILNNIFGNIIIFVNGIFNGIVLNVIVGKLVLVS